MTAVCCLEAIAQCYDMGVGVIYFVYAIDGIVVVAVFGNEVVGKGYDLLAIDDAGNEHELHHPPNDVESPSACFALAHKGAEQVDEEEEDGEGDFPIDYQQDDDNKNEYNP